MAQVAEDEPQAPARVISGDFRNTRNISTRAGAKKAWERVPAFQSAYENGLLKGPEKDFKDASHKEWQRYEAGKAYTLAYLKAQKPGRDVLAGEGLGGGNDPHQGMVALLDARSTLRRLDGLLSPKNREILAYHLGEDYRANVAVRMALGNDYEKAVAPRLREALDDLVRVMG